MDNKLVKNYLYNILYQVVRLVLPLFTVAYLQAKVGAATLGIADKAGIYANWFILFGVLGVNVYGNRQIAKVRNDKKELSAAFFEIFLMQAVNTTFAGILYLFYVHFTVGEYSLISYLYIFTIFASAFDITWFYYGIEDFRSASLRNTFVKVLGVALIFMFVKSPNDLALYVIINSFSELVGQVIMLAKVPKYIEKVPFTLKSAYQHHFKGTIALFIPTIAIQVYTLLDQTMLGILSDDTADLNLYKTAQSFVKIFLAFITSIGSVMLPRVTNTFYNDENGKEKSVAYISQTLKIALLLALPMTVAMITVSPYFFPWYLHESPDIVPRLVLLVQYSSPIILAISLSNVFGIQYLVPTGRVKEYTLSVILGAVANFIFNALMIPRLGGVGAAFGSVLAETTVTLTQFYFLSKDTRLHLGLSPLKYLLATLLMGLSVYVLGQTLGAHIYTNALQALCGAAVYGITLIILKDEMVFKAKELVRRKKNG